MLKSLRFLLVLLALAGLPLQGIAAATMAFCQHAAPDAIAQVDAHQGHHGDAHPEHDSSGSAKQICGDCTVCHLCNVFALSSANAAAGRATASGFVTRLTHHPDGFLPDQPRRPPLG
ncbi:MAG TPA: hypothetical protein VFP70_07220 [Burkholderiales bacterium]|nr:hypothetical protein [Burkholderiales bacterium]